MTTYAGSSQQLGDGERRGPFLSTNCPQAAVMRKLTRSLRSNKNHFLNSKDFLSVFPENDKLNYR